MSRRAPQEAGERTSPLDAMLSSRFLGILKREVATCTRYNLSRVRACQAPSCYMHRGSDPHSPHSEEGPTLTRRQRAHRLTLEPPPPHQPPGVWSGQVLLYSSSCTTRCFQQRSAVTGIEDEFEQSSLYLYSLFSLQVGVSRLAVNPANRR